MSMASMDRRTQYEWYQWIDFPEETINSINGILMFINFDYVHLGSFGAVVFAMCWSISYWFYCRSEVHWFLKEILEAEVILVSVKA